VNLPIATLCHLIFVFFFIFICLLRYLRTARKVWHPTFSWPTMNHACYFSYLLASYSVQRSESRMTSGTRLNYTISPLTPPIFSPHVLPLHLVNRQGTKPGSQGHKYFQIITSTLKIKLRIWMGGCDNIEY
jgi:hypothetical protein